MEKCSRNCFECEFPDCIVDYKDMSLEEYKEINRRDSEIYRSRGELVVNKAEFGTTYSKAYYISHKEELARRARERYHRLKEQKAAGGKNG